MRKPNRRNSRRNLNFKQNGKKQWISKCTKHYWQTIRRWKRKQVISEKSHPIWVAIAYYENDDSFTGWFSRGWYEIEPGETKVLIGGDLEYNTYYFYAYDTRGAEWKGAGKYSFIVDNSNAFEIKNANKSYQLKDDREFKSFKKINTQGQKSHTLSFAESEEE